MMKILLPVLLLVAAVQGVDGADPPSATFALKNYRPVQSDVEYERPSAADVARCRVRAERGTKATGWVVVAADGHVLRRFIDTNGDANVDQWRYFDRGVEVYRDIDGDFNGKVDQSRWLNTAGTRWGIDSNEDGRIDAWKRLSAEEASRLAVAALAARDAALLATIVINQQDVRSLGIAPKLASRLLASVSNPRQKIEQALGRSTAVTAATKWVRFDCTQPGLVPADEGKATRDLVVYENTLAIVETAGGSGLVLVGELVRVGLVWKLTSIPRPLVGETVQVDAGGLLMQPAAGDTVVTAPGTGVTPEMRELLDRLRRFDEAAPAPTAGAAVLAKYHSQRADLLTQLANASATAGDRVQWLKQLIDGLAASVQTGTWPGGLARLASLEAHFRDKSPSSSLVPFIAYRHLMARYSHDLQGAQGDRQQQVQSDWLVGLERFTREHPNAEDAPEALWQVGISDEFAGKTDEARRRYSLLVKRHGRVAAGIRAAGALRRLDLNGKPLAFTGKGLDGRALSTNAYRGRVLLVVFWASWCTPCTEELPALQALYSQYRARGFEILGINLDLDSSPIRPYLARQGIAWPQLHEPGGLDSRPARQFGIISLPTMFLVNRQGTVVRAGTTIDEVKTQLPGLLGAASP